MQAYQYFVITAEFGSSVLADVDKEDDMLWFVKLL